MTHKVCKTCKVEKPIKEFRRERFKTSTRVSCRDCELKQGRQLNRLHAAHKAPENGRCEICGDQTKLQLDHCHIRGEKRGWLCRRCNQGLAKFHDRQAFLLKAAHYLNQFAKTEKKLNEA